MHDALTRLATVMEPAGSASFLAVEMGEDRLLLSGANEAFKPRRSRRADTP